MAAPSGSSPAARRSRTMNPLRAVERDLLARYGRHWMLPARPDHGEVGFARGFIESWSCDATELFGRGKRVARATPLRALRVSAFRRDHVNHLPRCSAIRRVRELELRGLPEWPFEALAGVPFTRLERLRLQGRPHRRSLSLVWMLNQPWAAKLRELIVDMPLEPEDERALDAFVAARQA